MVEIVYKDYKQKIYGLDRLIKLQPKEDKIEEQIRSRDDYTLDFSALLAVADSDKVQVINFYTDREDIKTELLGKAKFKELIL